MGLKRIKISELTLSDNLKGLYTIGVKLINGVQTSVKVSLEHIQTAYENAVAATKKAETAAIVRTPQRVQPTVPLLLPTVRQRKQTRRRGTLTRQPQQRKPPQPTQTMRQQRQIPPLPMRTKPVKI